MDSNFDKVMDFVLKWEGGYVNNPSDPGGETKYGISKRAHPSVDISSLTLEDAKKIYFDEYWTPLGCSNFQFPLDLICMDTGVNMGVGRAREFLAQTDDWRDYWFLRLQKYMSMRKKYPQFIWGWINRIMELYKYAREG